MRRSRRRRRAPSRVSARAALLVASVHERDLHAAAFEARAGKRTPRLGGRVPEAPERHVVIERNRAPNRLVEDAYVRGQIAACEQRIGCVRIVVTGRHEHGFAEARELLGEKAERLRPGPLAFVEIAADGQRVDLRSSARSTMRAKASAIAARRAPPPRRRETSFRGARPRSAGSSAARSPGAVTARDDV